MALESRGGSRGGDALLGARDVVNDDIYDHNGRCLGEIEDLMFDPQSGCVRYAVVSIGGILGFGRRRYAVPWSALKPDVKLRRSVVDVARMRLMALPLATDGQSGRLPVWVGGMKTD